MSSVIDSFVPSSIPWSSHPLPYSLSGAIQKYGHLLTPPVCNFMLHSADCEFKVMIVGGPNVRNDFHIEDGEEFFYQLQGDMVLRILDGNALRDIVIAQGECFLLPAGIPHSPQRFANTVGLVIEHERKAEQMDRMRWYCQKCCAVLAEFSFRCENLGVQIKDAIHSYYANDSASANKRICQKCGTVDAPVDTVARNAQLQSKVSHYRQQRKEDTLKEFHSLPTQFPFGSHCLPLLLSQWIQDNRALLAPPVGNKMIWGKGCQFKVMIVGGPNIRTDYHINEGEEFFYQLSGNMILKVNNGGKFEDIHIDEGQCFLLPKKVPHSPQRFAQTIGLVIERERTDTEMDRLVWYCPNQSCRQFLHGYQFHCEDLGSQLVTFIEQWYSHQMEAKRVCPKCGAKDEKPAMLQTRHTTTTTTTTSNAASSESDAVDGKADAKH